MFIDTKRVVALEYIFYQKEGGNYSRLRHHVDQANEAEQHKLGAEEYDWVKTNLQNNFTNKPIVLDGFGNHLEGQNDEPRFMEANDGCVVEAIISLWNISKTG